MADAWGENNWGEGFWGQQSSITVSVTGLSSTTALGTETVEADCLVTLDSLQVSSTLGTLVAEPENVYFPTGVSFQTQLSGVTVNEGAGVVGGEAGDVRQDGSLVLLKVGEDGTGGAHCEGLVGAVEGVQGGGTEMGQKERGGLVWVEATGLEVADGCLQAFGRVLAFGEHQLGWAQAVRFGGQEVGVYLGDGELARAHVHVGDAGSLPFEREGGQVIVGALVEQIALDHRAGGDHAHNLALHERAALRSIADLLADSDLVPFGD